MESETLDPRAVSADRGRFSWGIGLALMATTIVFTGCGGDQKNKCRGVVCSYGVCNPATGKCANAQNCGTAGGPGPDAGSIDAGAKGGGGAKKSRCLPGYTCVAGSCEPAEPCSDEQPCQQGTCEDGVCVNQKSCENKKDCIAGWFCNSETNSCIENACADKSCQRGVCDRYTGECVNAAGCPSPEGAPPACKKGFHCLKGSCVSEDEICAKLDCDRGVCGPEEGKCVNAESCSEDRQCIDGYFCSEEGTCLENKCKDGQTCMRGVCDKKTGECVNPETCSSPQDCISMNVCVEREGKKTCVPRDKACGESGCPGDQKCTYDGNALTAVCEEPSNCDNALDCKSERVCKAASCTNPSSCTADGFEPNDNSGEATPYADNTRGGRVSASICSGDTDVYTFDTSQTSVASGEMTVELSFDPPDVGIGTLSLKVVDPQGNTVASKTSDSGTRGEISVTESFGPADRGKFELVVSDTGDVTTAGIDYSLFADVVGDTVAQHCDQAEQLKSSGGKGNTLSGASVGLGASCVQKGDQLGEDVYKFSVSKKSLVEISVDPTVSTADLAVSLRRTCISRGSEMACVNGAASGSSEQLTQTVEPGTYYVIVQGAGPKTDSGGQYDLSFSTQTVRCTQADNTCIGQKARVCNERGTGFKTVTCSNGCDPARGVCRRPKGDVCYDTESASSGLSGETVDWSKLKGDIDPGPGSCAGANAGGPDAVYEVRVPAGHALSARLTMGRAQTGSLYVLGSCSHNASSCREGASSGGGIVKLQYQNDSMSMETVFVVADSQQGTTGSATLDLSVGKVVCKPGEATCKSGDVHTCNPAGTAFKRAQSCPNGCANGTCRGQACRAPIDASGGGSWTVDIGKYSNTYNLQRQHCANDDLDAPDAIFKAKVSKGEVLRAKVTPQSNSQDPAIYVVTNCSSTTTHASTCLSGMNESTDGPETVFVDGPSSGSTDYFVVVDGDGSPTARGQWKVDIDVKTPSCTPAETKCSSGKLKYCGARGLGFKTYKCQGGANSCVTKNGRAQCKSPTGSHCADAKPVAAGKSVSGNFQGTEEIEMSEGRSGRCYFPDETDGPEEYYAVDLKKGQLLRANLATSHSDANLFVLGNCLKASSCLARASRQGASSVSYFASNKERVYVVVDTTDGSGDSANYKLKIDVQSNKTCSPGATRCLAGGSRVGRCNSTGDAFAAKVGCKNGCKSGACSYKQSQINACSSASDIGTGTVVSGTFQGLNDDVTVSSSGCVVERSDGNDSSYEVRVQPGEVLHARLDALGLDEPVLYAVENCSKPGKSCVVGNRSAAGRGGTAEIFYRPKQAKTLTLVADSTSSRSNEPFRLFAEVQKVQCQPGARRCGAQGKTLEYCSQYGLWKSIRCNGGCSGGRCNKPGGDVCVDAIPVKPGSTVQGKWSGRDSIRLGGGRTGGCFLDQSAKTSGAEKIYSVSLRKGDLLEAKLQTSVSDAQMMIFGDCQKTDTCAANDLQGGATTQYYYAKSRTRAYIVVDATSPSVSGSFKLSVGVRPNSTCAAGDTMCLGPNSVGTCNNSGTGFKGRFSCSKGCKSGACRGDGRADACGTAPTVGKGIAAYHDYGALKNNVNIKSSSSCVNEDGDGPEAIYGVDVGAGEILHAAAQSKGGEEPLVYIVGDCSNPGPTCLAGGDGTGDHSEAYYVAKQAKTLYVVADSTTSRYDEPFELRIETLQPQCQLGQRTCSSNGKNLRYCDSHKLWGSFACNGGCKQGSARCKNPTGNRCLDAKPLSKNGSFSGTFADFDNRTNPTVGSCGIHHGDDRADGPDAVFAVDLKAGDALQAEVQTSGTDTNLYVAGDCAPGKSFSCLHGRADTSRLSFYASKTKTYYLVVDTQRNSSDKFSLNLSTSGGKTCRPGGTTCKQGSGQLAVCSSDGSSVRATYNCQGSCSGQFCSPPMQPNDKCTSAYTISGGTRILDEWSRFSNNYDPNGNCNIRDGDGREAVYEIQLGAKEVVTAELKPQDDGDDPALYIVSNCSSPGQSCQAGASEFNQPVETGYYNSSNSSQTVFLVADTNGTNDDGPFVLDVDVRKRECKPNPSQQPARCTGSNTSEVCTNLGLYKPETCHFGCNRQTGRCKSPPNDACGGAIPVKSGGTFKGPMGSFSGNYDPAGGAGSSCTGDSASGPDAVYSATMSKNDILDLSLETPDDASLWVTSNCQSAASSCVAGSDRGDPEQLTFQAPTAGKYFIMVDVDGSNPSGTYQLDVNYAGPPQCSTPSTMCSSNGKKLNYCVPPGMFNQYTCPKTCVTGKGKCKNEDGEVCPVAVDASGGGKFTIDATKFSDDYDLPSNGCAGDDTPGPDRVYRVRLKKKQNLTATLTPQSAGNDPVLYASTRCGSAATITNSCVAGSDSNVTGKETIRVQAPNNSGKTFYIIADADSPNQASGKWTLDLNVQTRTCQPARALSCKNATTLNYCNKFGTKTKTLSCNGGCNNGQCGNPKGDICADAKRVTSPPQQFSPDMTTYSDTIDMNSSSCLGEDSPGHDVVFQVAAQGGRTIQVKTTPTSQDGDPMIYIARDCGQLAATSGATCVAGVNNNSDGGGETLSYSVPQGKGGRYWVVVDAQLTSDSKGKFTTQISVQ